ncbi:MAG: ATP-binding cassette domain-containing protein, partial [Lachnospiraceae bacterium]|nr:ATP-binding cassette domain-containing protein [Lachnospiraceae bacterium]
MKNKNQHIEGAKKSHVFVRLLKYARPFAGRMALCLAMVLVITLLNIFRPIILGEAIDIFVENGDFGEVIKKGITYMIILAVILGLEIGSGLILEYTGQQIIFNMRREVFEHVHRLQLRFFDITPVGKIVTRVTNDVESLNELFSRVLVRMVKNIFHIVGLIVAMTMLNIKLSATTFAFIPFIIVLTLLFQKVSRACHRVTRTRITAINTYLSEHISGMKLIKVFAREREKNAEFTAKSRSLYRANFREVIVFAVFRPSIYLLYVLALVSVLRFGGGEVLAGVMSVGTLYTFVQYVGTLFDPIQEMSEQLATLQQALASGEKIFTLLDEEVTVNDPEEPKKLGKVRGKIEFDHVWFAYDGENYVLRDVSFTIEPGQRVAFVGATGAGKSSILNLIGRYYYIQKGRILVDDRDIRDLSMQELRAEMGQVQ